MKAPLKLIAEWYSKLAVNLQYKKKTGNTTSRTGFFNLFWVFHENGAFLNIKNFQTVFVFVFVVCSDSPLSLFIPTVVFVFAFVFVFVLFSDSPLSLFIPTWEATEDNKGDNDTHLGTELEQEWQI